VIRDMLSLAISGIGISRYPALFHVCIPQMQFHCPTTIYLQHRSFDTHVQAHVGSTIVAFESDWTVDTPTMFLRAPHLPVCKTNPHSIRDGLEWYAQLWPYQVCVP